MYNLIKIIAIVAGVNDLSNQFKPHTPTNHIMKVPITIPTPNKKWWQPKYKTIYEEKNFFY